VNQPFRTEGIEGEEVVAAARREKGQLFREPEHREKVMPSKFRKRN